MTKRMDSTPNDVTTSTGAPAVPFTEHRPLVVIVANQRGGVGKTTVAAAIGETMIGRGGAAGFIEIESSPRLSLIYGDAVHLVQPTSLQAAAENPSRAFAIYDEITDRTVEGDIIIDVGANEIGSFAEWAEASLFAEDVMSRGHRLLLVGVATAEREAMAGALDVLYDKSRSFPGAERILVLNGAMGAGFDDWFDLRAMEADGIQLVPFPRCLSDMWRIVDGKRPMRLAKALKLTRADLEEDYGMSRAMSARAVRSYADWVTKVMTLISGTVIDESGRSDMSEAGGMIPHHLFTEVMARHRAEVDRAYVRERDRLIRHIRSLPPAERRIYLCSDEEALVLSAADRRDLMVESNAESEAAVAAFLRRQSWREVATWTTIFAIASILAMMSGGLVQVSAALDLAQVEGRVPLPSEQQVALRRINEIGISKFTDVPLAELRQRAEMPRQMIDVWQRLEVNDATSSLNKEERERLRIDVVSAFLHVTNTPEIWVQKRGIDLLTNLFGNPERRSEILENLCRGDRVERKQVEGES